MFNAFSQGMAALLASDAALMMLSMGFGILVGMLWSGRAFPRRLPRAIVRAEGMMRRGF